MLSSAARFGVVHAAGGRKRSSGGGEAPANTLLPLLNRVYWNPLAEGGSLSGTSGTWSGAEPITYTYQWYFNATDLPVSGETLAMFQNPDVLPFITTGAEIYLQVTATNAFGAVSARSSNICFLYNGEQ
jgi:hypothetical protein